MNKTVTETGPFGKIYRQFRGKPKQAIKHLMKVKEGECVAALHRPDIGDIDIVWGENDTKNHGYGLKHIIEKHGKSIKELGFNIEEFIPIVVQYGNFSIKKSDKYKIILESNNFRIIIKTKWNNKNKTFLLSAFDI